MARSSTKHCMSLSTLFLTILAIYTTVILLCFQSTQWPLSVLRHLLAPLRPTLSSPPTGGLSQQFEAPSPAARTLLEPLSQINIVPLSNRKSAVEAAPLPPPPSHSTPTPVPTPAAQAPLVAASPSPSFSRTNDLPASSSFTPPVPSSTCSTMDLRHHSHKLYTLHYAAIDTAQLGVALNVTVYQNCNRPATQPVRVTFRLHVTGIALAAAPGVQLREAEWHTSALLRLPDAGEYTLMVRVQAVNVSSDMEALDWPPRVALQFDQIPGQRWADKDILGSPVNLTIPSSSYALHRLLSHAELQMTSPTALPLPLCWTHAATPQLDGRWVLGPRHDHIHHHYPSTSIFDDYAAVYAPYDCSIDYTARILPALHSLQWLHLIGDSNIRALFVRLCEAADGVMHSGDPTLGGWDLPRLCTIPRDVSGDGSMVANATVITYTNWFFVKKLPLDATMTFSSHCARYTEDTKQIEKDGMVYGWPECQHTHHSIYQLNQPALTYFGWGNHQAEMGASDTTRRYMRDVLFSHDYWRGRHGLMAFTEDLDASRLAGYWAPHFVFRNNPRVRAVNAMMREVVEECMEAGLMVDGAGLEGGGRGWLPMFDAFSVTHAGSEVLHGDTVHFWPELEKELVKLVAHYITHAPQLPMAKAKMRHG